MKYKQCKLVKSIDGYHGIIQTCWIPGKYAIIGDVLKIKYKGEWEDGWRVKFIYSDRLVEEDEIPDARRIRRIHRKKTGDSLPK